MAKSGSSYEQLVAEVASAFHPGARVSRGIWKSGPDGKRELDVLITGLFQGRAIQILIECKDYNPSTTGKVGIEKVDAIDSKSRDLACDFRVICSNAGFTDGAIRKAARVGVGLIAVMSSGDSRVRFQVEDEIFFRDVEIFQSKDLTINTSVKNLHELVGDRPIKHLHAYGVSIWPKFESEFAVWLAQQTEVNGQCLVSVNFATELPCVFLGSIIPVSAVKVKFSFTGTWRRQMVKIDATKGIYDWLSHSPLLAPGPNQFSYRDVDFDNGEAIDSPPEWVLKRLPDSGSELQLHEISLAMLSVRGLVEAAPSKELDEFFKCNADVNFTNISP